MYRALMVPLDGTGSSEQVLPFALAIARRAGAHLHLVHVRYSSQGPDNGIFFEHAPALAPDHGESYLEDLATVLSARWSVPVTADVLYGPIVAALAIFAQQRSIDLVAMASRGRGLLSRLCHRSVTARLIDALPLPFLLTRSQAAAADARESVHEPAFQHLLIPLDGSAFAETILDPALELGSLMASDYTLLRAVPPDIAVLTPALTRPARLDYLPRREHAARDYLDGVANRLRATGARITTRVTTQPITQAIAEVLRDRPIDLIALAVRRPTDTLWGAASQALRHAPSSLLLYGPPDCPVYSDAPSEQGARASHAVAQM